MFWSTNYQLSAQSIIFFSLGWHGTVEHSQLGPRAFNYSQTNHDGKHMMKFLVLHLIVSADLVSVQFVALTGLIGVLGSCHWCMNILQSNGSYEFAWLVLQSYSYACLVVWPQLCTHSCKLLIWTQCFVVKYMSIWTDYYSFFTTFPDCLVSLN